MEPLKWLANLFRRNYAVALLLFFSAVCYAVIHLPPVVTSNIQVTGATASTVPYFDSSENLISSSTTSTEIGYVHGVTSALCGINQSCTETNKTLTSPIFTSPSTDVMTFTEQSSTPASPSSGNDTLFVDNTGTPYIVNSSGTKSPLGSGGSGSGINILNAYNYNAELGATTDWTNSAGTFSVISSPSADVGNGTYSFTFTASASGQDVTSNLTAIPAGLYSQNCELDFYYKGFDSNMTAEVTDGTNVIASEALTASTGYTEKQMNFICPSSGSMEMELVSTGSSAQGFWDEVHLGSATNLGQVSQAQLVGQIKMSGCAAPWSTASSTMAAFSAQTGCAYTVLNGAGVSAPSTDIPGIKFSSLAPGNYILAYEGTIGAYYVSTTASAQFQFTDGTNFANEISDYGNAPSGYLVGSTIRQTIAYNTAQSNVTLQIYGLAQSGVDARVFGTTGNPGVISVYRFPTSSQLAWSPSTAPASWNATSTLSGTTTSTTFADPGSVTGAITVTGTPRNITCTADGTLLGIDCTLPREGNYQVCYTGYFAGSAVSEVASELTDGSNTIIVGEQKAAIASGTYTANMGNCGNYTASSTSVTFKVKGLTNSGTATFTPTSFSVTGLDQSMNAPMAVGSVTSSASDAKFHMEGAHITCTSGGCTITSQSGSWISSVTRNSVGNSTVNFTTGEFSAAPWCSITPDSYTVQFGSLSSSSINIVTYNSSAGAVDTDYLINCLGPD